MIDFGERFAMLYQLRARHISALEEFQSHFPSRVSMNADGISRQAYFTHDFELPASIGLMSQPATTALYFSIFPSIDFDYDILRRYHFSSAGRHWARSAGHWPALATARPFRDDYSLSASNTRHDY